MLESAIVTLTSWADGDMLSVADAELVIAAVHDDERAFGQYAEGAALSQLGTAAILLGQAKTAGSSGCESHPATGRSSRKQSERGEEATTLAETLRCRRVASGDSASVQAVTRANAEQASKQSTGEPTRLSYGEGRCWWGKGTAITRRRHQVVTDITE